MRHKISDISTYSLMAKGREMSTLPVPLQRVRYNLPLTLPRLSRTTV